MGAEIAQAQRFRREAAHVAYSDKDFGAFLARGTGVEARARVLHERHALLLFGLSPDDDGAEVRLESARLPGALRACPAGMPCLCASLSMCWAMIAGAGLAGALRLWASWQPQMSWCLVMLPLSARPWAWSNLGKWPW